MEGMLTRVEGVQERMGSEKLGIESMHTLLNNLVVDGSQAMESGINRTRGKMQGQGRASFFPKENITVCLLMCVTW